MDMRLIVEPWLDDLLKVSGGKLVHGDRLGLTFIAFI